MRTLTKENYGDTIDIVLTKACKISPNLESKKVGVHKTVNVEVSYKRLTFGDLMAKALKGDVISFQNGAQGRAKYESITNGQTVKVDATSPGASYLDINAEYEKTFLSKDKTAQMAELEKLAKIAGVSLKSIK